MYQENAVAFWHDYIGIYKRDTSTQNTKAFHNSLVVIAIEHNEAKWCKKGFDIQILMKGLKLPNFEN